MKATIAYVEKKFEEFNGQIFAGRRPKLPLELSDVSSTLGQCVFQVRLMPDGTKEYSDFRMKINTRIDLPENLVEDVIIHEMIHYFILLNGLHDTAPHGEIFMAIMRSINGHFGRHITVAHNSTTDEQEQAISTKRTWHVIADIHFKNGDRGVKVLPRTVQKIIAYNEAVKKYPEVDHVDFYLHDNPFFNRYPTSVAFRIHEIDSDVIIKNLAKARKLRVTATQVVETR